MDNEYTREQKDYEINDKLDDLLLDDFYFKQDENKNKEFSGGKPKTKRRTKKRKTKRRKTRKERK
jgi:hypothetical protein